MFALILSKSEVRLLATLKPIKSQAWWKVCFILEAGKWWLEVGGWTPVRRLAPLPGQPVGKSFDKHREGLHAETAESALTVILKLVTGGLTSVILIVLSTVSLQFHNRFVPIFLEGSSLNCGSLRHGYSLVIM